MAGSSNTLTSDSIINIGYSESKRVRKIIVDWVGDDATGAVPNLTLSNLQGYVIKAITNPGSTAPTSNYDIALGDPLDNSLDALASLLNNRSATVTEQVYTNVSGATTPIWLDKGDYVLSVTNNSVNSATGQIVLYLTDEL